MYKTKTLNLGLMIQVSENVDNNQITPNEAKHILVSSGNMLSVIDPSGNNFVTDDLDKVATSHWINFIVCMTSGMSLNKFLNLYGDIHNVYIKARVHVN